jgi:hypothetical protein
MPEIPALNCSCALQVTGDRMDVSYERRHLYGHSSKVRYIVMSDIRG